MTNSTHAFPLLDEDNFQSWQPDMQAYLQRKGLWRLVNGDESPPSASAPTEPKEYGAWAKIARSGISAQTMLLDAFMKCSLQK